MEIEIVEEKDNKLLNRKELKLNLKHPNSPTPKKQELVKEVASRYSVTEDQVVVDYIFTKKGLQESLAKVKIYPKKVEAREGEAQVGEAK